MENLMEKIRIITDSASDLSASTREDLTILPLAIRFGDTEYLDGQSQPVITNSTKS